MTALAHRVAFGVMSCLVISPRQNRYRIRFHVFFCTIFGRFVVGLPVDRLLCPVWAIRFYLGLTASVSLGPHECVFPTCLTRKFSTDSIWSFLRRSSWLLRLWCWTSPRAHSVQGITSSSLFLYPWLFSKVLRVPFWGSSQDLLPFICLIFG